MHASFYNNSCNNREFLLSKNLFSVNNISKGALPIVLFIQLLIISPQLFAQNTDTTKTSSVVADGAKPILISKQFKFTEGPAKDRKGNIFFTDQPNNKIWKYSTDGKLSLFLDNAGRSNGLYFDKKGNLVAAADEKNQLWSITPKGKIKVLIEKVNGKLLNGPNDLWIHPGGGIYFTDPYYQRSYFTRTQQEMDGQKVYYLAKRSKEPIEVAAQFVQPNGIVGTADGSHLFVADIGDKKTYKYRIAKDGTLEERTLFVNQGSDGMTIDNKGNIYLTGKGVMVFDSTGKQIEHIPISEGWTANVTFGGRNNDQLFITASEAVYKLDMKVKGVE